MEEHQLIPFEASGVPEGPWLVFAPHPDDESFGMGGSLLLARNHDIEVSIVFLTGGGWMESDSSSHSNSDELVSERQAEAQRACEFLGIRRYEFWRELDRHLKPVPALVKRTSETIQRLKPHVVYFPAPTELHPDHRATCDIVCAAAVLGDHDPQLATYDIGVQSPVNYLVDTSSVRSDKQELMSIYASQTENSKYIELVNSLDFARTFTLPGDVQSAEGFFFLRYESGDVINAFDQMTRLLRGDGRGGER